MLPSSEMLLFEFSECLHWVKLNRNLSFVEALLVVLHKSVHLCSVFLTDIKELCVDIAMLIVVS